MTKNDLFDRLNDEPFKPFRINTTLNDVYEIRERWMVWVGESSATIAFETQTDARGNELVQRFRTVALSHMVTMEDIAPSKGKAASRRERSQIERNPRAGPSMGRPAVRLARVDRAGVSGPAS